MKKNSLTPQWVSRSLDLTKWGITKEQIKILALGPEDVTYWKVWEEVLTKAKKTVDGEYFSLFQCERGVLIVSEDFDPEARAF